MMNGASRNSSGEEDYDSEDGEVFLDEEDVLHEIPIDEEELPDRDDEQMDSDVDYEEVDDSFYVFKGHTDELYSVACSPTDGSLIATGGKDDRGFLWKIGSQDSGLELKGHRNTVSTLAFSSDGQLLATGSFDGLIQVWDANLGSLKCALEGSGGGVEWLKWHPKGHLILAGSEDSSVWLWNADKSLSLNTFYGHASSVTCGDFSSDGKIICTGSDDASLRIWNPKTGDSINVKGHPYHTDGLTCLSITHDSTIALTGSKDSSVHMVNLATGRVISSLVSHSDSVECLGFSPRLWYAIGSAFLGVGPRLHGFSIRLDHNRSFQTAETGSRDFFLDLQPENDSHSLENARSDPFKGRILIKIEKKKKSGDRAQSSTLDICFLALGNGLYVSLLKA